MDVRRKQRVGVVALSLAAVFAAGCNGKQVKDTPKASPYAEPALEFRGIGFEDQSFDGTSVVFKFALISQDDRPASLAGCPYKLELIGSETLRGKVNLSGELGPKAEQAVNAKLAVPWPEGREQVMAFLHKKRLPYKYHLTCELSALGKKVTVSNTDAGSIPLPKLPQMDVIQANAERFGADSARVNFELSMLNENTFQVNLDKIIYKVALGGIEVTKGNLPLAEVIPPSAEFTYDVNTPIFNTSDNKDIMDLLNQPQIEYTLTGTIHLGQFQLPLDAQGTITFARAGAAVE